jgi:hypothetical protein
MEDELGAGMFANCSNLESVWLPTSITKIGTGAFCNCSNLKYVVIPSNIQVLGWECFLNDKNLIQLTPYSATAGETADLSKITVVNSEAFSGCSSLPSSYYASLTGVNTIGFMAFQNTLIDTQDAQQLLNQFQYGNTNSSHAQRSQIPERAFAGCKNITGVIDLTACTHHSDIHGIYDGAFADCSNMTGIKINSEVTSLGKEAFSGCTSLASIEVNSATAPTCGTDVFKGVVPNTCEVVFANDAAIGTNYTSYRGNSTFMALLTKTMDEDNTNYTVVPQRHADVVLHRTFKEGWNTLALPFGSAYDANKTTYGAQIFMNALHKGSSNDFMIAAYRGLNTTTNTFYFLQYANGTDPLDEFEPLLIKMGADDIASDDKYTFSNVEVNYDANENKEYAASEVNSLIGKLAGTTSKYVDGNYNHDLNSKFQACSYNDFFFTGTLYKRSIVTSNTASDFIQTGDFLIQNNNFYKVAADKTYGLKGFRGWFKQLPSSNPAKPSTFSINVVDEENSTTDIVKIDANGEEVKDAKIYNISGQYVGTSHNGLSKGIYILNGKKFVVK